MSQNEINWPALIEQMEAQVRSGFATQTALNLKALSPSQIPRGHRAQLSDIARRASLPLLALQILSPVLNSKFELSTPASDLEKVTYASALPMLGLNSEAIQILQTLNVESRPEVLLSQSFAYFGMWDYQTPIPLLKRYIQSSRVSDYMKIVGRVNLIACFTSLNKVQQARLWIERTRPMVLAGNYTLLAGNLLELEAQTYIQEKKFHHALEILNRARSTLASTGGLYLSLVDKWIVICELFLDPQSQHAIKKLHEIKGLSQTHRYWEILRDCDLYIAIAQGRIKDLEQIVFGTPHASFRKRAEQILGKKISLRQTHFFQPSPQPYLLSEVVDSRAPDLLKHPTLHRALEALGSDFFKPVSLGSLFRQVYPGEVFDPYSSPKRVFNTILRLRRWFKHNNWQLSVQVSNLEFSLTGTGPLRVYLRKHRKELSLLEAFRRSAPPSTFSSQILAKNLHVSQRQAQIVLKAGRERGLLTSTGKGRATIYQFANYRK